MYNIPSSTTPTCSRIALSSKTLYPPFCCTCKRISLGSFSLNKIFDIWFFTLPIESERLTWMNMVVLCRLTLIITTRKKQLYWLERLGVLWIRVFEFIRQLSFEEMFITVNRLARTEFPCLEFELLHFCKQLIHYSRLCWPIGKHIFRILLMIWYISRVKRWSRFGRSCQYNIKLRFQKFDSLFQHLDSINILGLPFDYSGFDGPLGTLFNQWVVDLIVKGYKLC